MGQHVISHELHGMSEDSTFPGDFVELYVGAFIISIGHDDNYSALVWLARKSEESTFKRSFAYLLSL